VIRPRRRDKCKDRRHFFRDFGQKVLVGCLNYKLLQIDTTYRLHW
jgi:hypothetical protein